VRSGQRTRAPGTRARRANTPLPTANKARLRELPVLPFRRQLRAPQAPHAAKRDSKRDGYVSEKMGSLRHSRPGGSNAGTRRT
jgi:hypothetical protein